MDLQGQDASQRGMPGPLTLPEVTQTDVCCTTLYWPVTTGATATLGCDLLVTFPTIPHHVDLGADVVEAAVGVDVGGGSLKVGAAVLDSTGAVHPAQLFPGLQELSPRTIPHGSPADPRTMDKVCAEAAQHTAERVALHLPGVPLSWGVAAAAWIRPHDGYSIFSPHLPAWRDHRLRDGLAGALAEHEGPLRAMPVVCNDADAAAWAEATLGAGSSVGRSGPAARRMVMVAIGTGIGGALVRDGVVETGAHGMAGEYGHLSLDPHGNRCACGGIGCWETLVSASALARRAGRSSARTTLDDALGGDPRCRAAVAQTGEWLGRGLTLLTAALDPDLLVIGGGLVAAGDLLLDPAREVLHSTLPGRGHRQPPEVAPARLGNYAGWLGAAGLALRPGPRHPDPGHDGRSPAGG